MSHPVSYNFQGAALAAGVSHDVIRRAVKAGDLIAHYPTSRPVILREELEEWIKASPTERREDKAA